MRSDISAVILIMMKLGIKNIVTFDFMDPPAPETMMRALENLNYLGALDDEGELTVLGNQMAELPLDPQLSKALLSSAEFGCVPEMLSITAMLSIPPFFLRPKGEEDEADSIRSSFSQPESDHISLLRVYDAYVQEKEEDRVEWCNEHYINPRNIANAINVREQLEGILTKLKIDVTKGNHFDDPMYITNIRKCLCAGFFMQAAHREQTGHYLTVKDNQVSTLGRGEK